MQAARGRCDAIIINAGRAAPTTPTARRRAGRLRRRRGRAAPHEPVGSRRVAAAVGRGAGRDRHRRRLRREPGYRLAAEAATGELARRADGDRPARPDGRGRPTGPAPGPPRRRGACRALLVTRLPNVRYLTGFSGSAATLLVTADELLLVTDGRYETQAGEQLAAAGVDARIEIGAHPGRPAPPPRRRALRRAVPDAGPRGRTASPGPSSGPSPACSPTSSSSPPTPLVETLRLVKDDGEVARIRAACAIGRRRARPRCSPALAAGPTEPEFAVELEHAMRRRGAAAMSFDPIVASGPNGAKPHAPAQRAAASARGELVVARLRLHRRRLLLRHDPHGQRRRPRRPTAAACWDLVAASPAGRARPRSRPAWPAPTSTGPAATVIDAAGLRRRVRARHRPRRRPRDPRGPTGRATAPWYPGRRHGRHRRARRLPPWRRWRPDRGHRGRHRGRRRALTEFPKSLVVAPT